MSDEPETNQPAKDESEVIEPEQTKAEAKPATAKKASAKKTSTKKAPTKKTPATKKAEAKKEPTAGKGTVEKKPARAKKPAEEEEPAGEQERTEEKPAEAKKPSEEKKPAPPAKPAKAPRRRVVRAHARYVRTSARKARMVSGHLPGKTVNEARAILAFTPREVARDWSKLLESAIANAENNHELLQDDLVVREAYANEGPTIKRFRPRAMGRATPINKRTSHLTITLTPGD
jgi:ribosomal protein L22